MPDYIEWYAVELKSRLDNRLKPARVEIIVQEAVGHLQQLALRYVTTDQMEPERAALKAINEFGSPRKVAHSFLRESDPRLLGLKPIWVVIGSAVTLSMCFVLNFMWLWGFFDNFGDTWQNGVAGFVGFGAAITLFLGCRAGYRSYAKPLALSGLALAGSLVFVLSFWIIGGTQYSQGISRFHASRDEANVRSVIKRLDRYDHFLSTMGPVIARADSLSAAPPELRDVKLARTNWDLDVDGMPAGQRWNWTRESILLPRDCFAMVDGRIFAFSTTDDWKEAKAAWAKSDSFLKGLRLQRAEMAGLLASLEVARQNHKLFFFNPAVFSQPVISALVIMLAVLLINGLAVLSRKLEGARLVVA